MNQREEEFDVYSAHNDISRLQPVPAHLFGTRRAIFALMRELPDPEAPPPRPVPRRPEPTPRACVEDLLLADRFVF